MILTRALACYDLLISGSSFQLPSCNYHPNLVSPDSGIQRGKNHVSCQKQKQDLCELGCS